MKLNLEDIDFDMEALEAKQRSERLSAKMKRAKQYKPKVKDNRHKIQRQRQLAEETG
jgi:hypothetical protein